VKDGGAEACTKEGQEYRVPVHGEMLPTAEPLSIMYTHRSKLRGSEDRALQKNLEASRGSVRPVPIIIFWHIHFSDASAPMGAL